MREVNSHILYGYTNFMYFVIKAFVTKELCTNEHTVTFFRNETWSLKKTTVANRFKCTHVTNIFPILPARKAP